VVEPLRDRMASNPAEIEVHLRRLLTDASVNSEAGLPNRGDVCIERDAVQAFAQMGFYRGNYRELRATLAGALRRSRDAYDGVVFAGDIGGEHFGMSNVIERQLRFRCLIDVDEVLSMFRTQGELTIADPSAPMTLVDVYYDTMNRAAQRQRATIRIRETAGSAPELVIKRTVRDGLALNDVAVSRHLSDIGVGNDGLIADPRKLCADLSGQAQLDALTRRQPVRPILRVVQERTVARVTLDGGEIGEIRVSSVGSAWPGESDRHVGTVAEVDVPSGLSNEFATTILRRLQGIATIEPLRMTVVDLALESLNTHADDELRAR
jgi:CYTH domain